jgi:hypothetical protein
MKIPLMSWQREAEKTIVDRVEELAKKKRISMAQVATAWILTKDGNYPLGEGDDGSCVGADCGIEFCEEDSRGGGGVGG